MSLKQVALLCHLFFVYWGVLYRCKFIGIGDVFMGNSDWNSNQYMKFGKERTQPSLDLISRIKDLDPSNILDIGCGPGNSTFALYENFPNAQIKGVDSSENMLKKAREKYPNMQFEKCNVPDDLGEESYDLIFSNACIHWIPNHQNLISEIFNKLNKGGTLAVQIPLTQEAPFYKTLFRLIENEKWSKLAVVHNFHNLMPNEYYDLFTTFDCDFQIWQTTYYHIVQSQEGVIEWYKGSGLRPYLELLDEEEKEDFMTELKESLKNLFPTQRDGKVILKMPRLFFTLQKDS